MYCFQVITDVVWCHRNLVAGGASGSKVRDMAIEGPNAEVRFVEDITEEFTGTFECRLGKTLYCQESDARENFGDLSWITMDTLLYVLPLIQLLPIRQCFSITIYGTISIYLIQ